MSRHRIPLVVRNGLWMRCGGRCDRCGQMMQVMDPHHRKQRSVGGKDTLSNLVGLHRLCHDKVHHDTRESTDKGYLVFSWDNPGEVPVRLFDGWFRLDDDGAVWSVPEPLRGASL